MEGIFISFEGIECAGKTTQHKKLCDYLEEMKIKFISTSEPGGTTIGKSIRTILLTNDKICNMASKAELFLFAADRNQHINELIKPSLEKGITVITDRFADSTFAYQAFGRGINSELIKNINDIATEGLYPDITFLLDISPEKVIKRLSTRAKATKVKLDRIEKEKLDFFQKVREGYLYLANTEAHRFKMLNAEEDIEEIHKKIIFHLTSFLKEKGKSISDFYGI